MLIFGMCVCLETTRKQVTRCSGFIGGPARTLTRSQRPCRTCCRCSRSSPRLAAAAEPSPRQRAALARPHASTGPTRPFPPLLRAVHSLGTARRSWPPVRGLIRGSAGPRSTRRQFPSPPHPAEHRLLRCADWSDTAAEARQRSAPAMFLTSFRVASRIHLRAVSREILPQASRSRGVVMGWQLNEDDATQSIGTGRRRWRT